MTIDLLEEKTIVHNFLRVTQKYVSNATVRSSNGIKLFFYSKFRRKQTMYVSNV